MTWSIVAHDRDTGEIGVAVATRFFAVGAIVPHVEPGVGAIATQALVNPFYGIDGMKLLRAGLPAGEAMARLLELDAGTRINRPFIEHGHRLSRSDLTENMALERHAKTSARQPWLHQS